MRSIRNATCCLLLALVTSTVASAQDDEANDVRAAIVMIVSKSLGGFETTKLSYWAKLEAERLVIDRLFYCSTQPRMTALSAPLVDEILQTIKPFLSGVTTSPVVYERPSYVEDLMVTAIVAFEYGRVLSRRESGKESICERTSTSPLEPLRDETPKTQPQE